jgi:uncharacterized membrane protein
MVSNTENSWIFWALLSAAATAARQLYIKQWCATIPAEVLIFATRLLGCCMLVPGLLMRPVTFGKPMLFALIVSVTVVVTAVATIIQVGVIQKSPISKSVPVLSFTPLFMVPWTILLLHESPTALVLAGLCLSCSGAYLLHQEAGMTILQPMARFFKTKSSLAMLAVAVMLGCTTACDKIGIQASTVFTYTLVWTLVSAMVMGIIAFTHNPGIMVRSAIFRRHTLIQGLFWTIAFASQMIGVGKAMTIPSGVTYVKMLTMFSILMTVAVGGTVFREGRMVRSMISSILMVAGAAVVLWAL